MMCKPKPTVESTIDRIWASAWSNEQRLFENDQTRALIDKANQLSAELYKTMTPEQVVQFEAIYGCLLEHACLREKTVFSYGFRWGGQLVLDLIEG